MSKITLKGLFFVVAIQVSVWSLLFVLFASSSVRAESIDRAFEYLESKDYVQAFQIFLRLAKKGDPKAQGTVARMYAHGWGTLADDKEAYYWASRGAQKNDPAAQNLLGYFNWHGLAGFESNLDEAIRWFELASAQKFLMSMRNLMVIYKQQNNLEKQIFWGSQLFELGDGFAAAEVSLAYEYSTHIPNHLEKSFDWAMKGAEAGNIESINLVGESYRRGLRSKERNQKEALKWLGKSAAKGSHTAHYLLGSIYQFGDSEFRDEKKAIESFEVAHALGRDEAAFVLAMAYLFGEGAIRPDASKGYELLRKLQASKSAHLAFEIESRIYLNGIDRPKNKQKAILAAMYGLNLEFAEDSWIEDRIGSFVGRSILKEDLLLKMGLPEVYDLAWYRLYAGRMSGRYQEYKREFAEPIVMQSEKLSFNEILNFTLEFLESRQREYGPIEAEDLVNEGWAQFIGKRGKVNEPLAQLLTEEGLRLAIRTKNEKVEHVARNNLGAILKNSINKFVRNQRLANIHLYDGRYSEWGPDNLLWNNYFKTITLSPFELNDLREKYKRQKSAPHRTLTMPEPPPEALEDFNIRIKWLEKLYQPGDLELAKQIGFNYERVAETPTDHEEALRWFELAKHTERAERSRKILKRQFVEDFPNLTGTIYQLFEVDLVETRGGLLTNLKSAISPARVSTISLDKSRKKLALHALVVGNSAYVGKPLKNSKNDARDIAKKLTAFGFNVTVGFDLDRRGFRDTLIKFSEVAKDSDVTVFFYAGHGMQLGGLNYLLPTDINFTSTQDIVTYDGISLNDIKARSLPGATRLIFLDACRNNPFSSNTRGSSNNGLAPVNVGTGTLISFATRDGSVALDSVGGVNSPYTQALLKHIDSTEDVELMLRAVGDEVMRLTKNVQQPWKYGALSGQKVVISTLAK